MVTLHSRCGHYIFALFLAFFFFSSQSQRSQIGCLPYFDTWCGANANLECRSEMCCTWLAGNAGPKNSPSGHHCTTLLYYIFATNAHIDNRKKNLLNSNVASTCPHNIVKYGPLAAEICWRVWGTQANFNVFHILAALLHIT